MDHVVYLDTKSKELDNMKKGIKSMIIRGAMGRKLPYAKVEVGDRLFLIENKGDGLINANALVANVFNSDQLTQAGSLKLVEKSQDKLLLDNGLRKRFGGKRYLVLITIKEFRELESFKIDRSLYGNMDDWLPTRYVEKVKNR